MAFLFFGAMQWSKMNGHTLYKLMQDHRPRLLDPVYTVSSCKLLLESQVPPDLPTVLSNVCRGLAKQALAHLEVE